MGTTQPKQYFELAGRSVIEWAIAPFLRLERCERVVVVLAQDDGHWRELALNKHPRVLRAPGGEERAHSVAEGLRALEGLAAPEDWVLVHDAARPCLSDEDLTHLIAALADDPVGGLLATRVVDTLKKADEAGYVAATLPREGLWRAMTPQMFRFGVLQRAIQGSLSQGLCPTDEAQAVELTGLRPKLVSGSADNIKITTLQDLDQARRILSDRLALVEAGT
jgi:2-C-methyl-D-erythritol 4-phosphate cytidylyltransferase